MITPLFLRSRLAAMLCVLALWGIGPSATAQTPPFKLTIPNGGMTQGGAVPAHWDGKFGDVDAARDTDVFKVGPASLRVSVTGGKSGQAFQTISGGAGVVINLAGWFKTAGSVKAQVMVQAFSDGYKQNQFFQIVYRQGDGDWAEFQKQITLPAWTAFFNVGVLAEGDGKAWLDEVHEASSPVDVGVAQDALTSGPPAKDKPDVPGWGFYPQFPQAWQNFHNGFLARTKQGGVSVVFLGDSITQGWGNDAGGKALFDARYAPLGAVNYGIGGDGTRQVLWRIGHGELDGISPRLVVLMIGTNNLYDDFNAGTDDEIAAGITKIVTTLRQKLPATKILLLGLLPRQNDYFCGRITHINTLTKTLDDGKTVRFFDMTERFETAPGKVRPELYNADQLHPKTAGYQVWADAMQPLFDALLKSPASGSAKAASKTPAAHSPKPRPFALPLVRPANIPMPANGWKPMPLVSPETLASGIRPGGEGCQYPQTIAIDSRNGSFLLYGTDVGGIFRSVDGGKTFVSCMMGYYAVGACGFAIDPVNIDRCLAVGDNTGQDGNKYYMYDGVYLSTDRGATWKQVLPKLNRGNEHGREQIAFDPSSGDAGRGFCTTAYWAEEGNADEPGGRLYKTTDGGETWAQIADGAAYGGGDKTAILKVAPQGNAVYIADSRGFFKSTDGGTRWTKTRDGSFTSLDVAARRPQFVWATTKDTLLRSSDGGRTFETIPAKGITGFLHLTVSPADPRRMVAADPTQNNARYASVDGGLTWTKSAKDMRLSWIPPEILYDDRCRLAVWHPTDPAVVWGIGPGDIITRSGDGAKTFAWANNGNNGLMTGGLFNFNAQNPDVLYVGSQDYNGTLTTDSGKTWRFINLSKDNTHAKRGDDGDAWGWVYGGYAASEQILYGGNRAFTEDQYNLWVTFDGGRTTQQKYADLHGAQVSCGDPTDPNVLFCWNARSADRGQNWTPMTGCDGVYTANPQGKHELYGRNGKDIVRSRDHGVTWHVLTTLPAAARDLGYDPTHDRVYAAADDNTLYECDGPTFAPVNIRDRLPKDQHGDGMMVSTVAVDPVKPSVVYAGANGTGLFVERDNAVARSVDGGQTWERLTCNPKYGVVTGGQMASAIRVYPKTRELFVGTDCYGLWRIAPPTP